MLYIIQNMMCKPLIGGKGADGRIGNALTTTMDLKFGVKYKAINQALSNKLASEQTHNQKQI
jgi:hypothetical protein